MESGSTSSNGAAALELIDTNVLVYAIDLHAPAKRRAALGLIDSLVGRGAPPGGAGPPRARPDLHRVGRGRFHSSSSSSSGERR